MTRHCKGVKRLKNILPQDIERLYEENRPKPKEPEPVLEVKEPASPPPPEVNNRENVRHAKAAALFIVV